MKTQQDIAGMALELGRLIRKEMDVHGGDAESPIRMHAACFIAERPGITMSAFAQLMKISPSTATTFIDRLVRAKLTLRKADPRNRKIVHLHLTPRGMKAVEGHLKRKQALLKKVFSRLSATDRTHLRRIFSLLLAHSPSSHD